MGIHTPRSPGFKREFLLVVEREGLQLRGFQESSFYHSGDVLPRQPQPKPVPAASFSFLFLLIVLVREIPEHLTKEKDKEKRERSEIVAKWYEVDRA